MSPAEKLAKELDHVNKSARLVKSRRNIVWKCKLKELRLSLDLSRADVEKGAGVREGVVFYAELGCDLQLSNAVKLCKFYGKTVEELWQPLSDPTGQAS